MLIEIIEKFKNTSSRNDKEDLLEKYKDNKLFVDVLKFVYNPFIVTGLSTKKINKKVKVQIKKEHEFVELESVIEYLLKNNNGRDYDIAVVQYFLKQAEDLFGEDSIQYFKDIFTKDLKIGLTSNTINKTYGKNTIHSFGVMLAESYKNHQDYIKGEFYVTKKIDGNRCIAVVDVDGVTFFTRKGKVIEGMNELSKTFNSLPNGVYDGETILRNSENLSTSELFRATQKEVRTDGKKENLEFYIFDCITLSEFKNGESTRDYGTRRMYLDDIITKLLVNIAKKEQNQNVFVLPILYKGDDKEEIEKLMLVAGKLDWEGLMINNARGLYKTKRVKDLLKVKKMATADLLCVSLENAIDGQFKDMMGRINVEYKGVLVGVGSGFTIEERQQFTENPDSIIGKIIEVSYFEETKNEKTGKPSLRFPVFKGIRDDKGIEDIRYE